MSDKTKEELLELIKVNEEIIREIDANCECEKTNYIANIKDYRQQLQEMGHMETDDVGANDDTTNTD